MINVHIISLKQENCPEFPYCRLGNLLPCVPKQDLLQTASPGNCAHFVAELTPTGTVSSYVKFFAVIKTLS